MSLSDTTLLVKTIERPSFLDRLLESIRLIYPPGHPDSPSVLVGDDARDHSAARDAAERWSAEFLGLDHDIGLSAGRNALVDAAKTPYVVVLDDDFVLFPYTDLGRLVSFVASGVFDIAGGTVFHNGHETHYEGWIRLEDEVLRMGPAPARSGPAGVDICYNFLAARREVLQRVRWNPKLKLCEHQDFFLRCQKAGVKVGYIPDVQINHMPGQEGVYTEYRKVRANGFFDEFKRAWGIECIQGTPAAPANRP